MLIFLAGVSVYNYHYHPYMFHTYVLSILRVSLDGLCLLRMNHLFQLIIHTYVKNTNYVMHSLVTYFLFTLNQA